MTFLKDVSPTVATAAEFNPSFAPCIDTFAALPPNPEWNISA